MHAVLADNKRRPKNAVVQEKRAAVYKHDFGEVVDKEDSVVESQVETAIVSIPKHSAIESPPVGCDPSDVREPAPIVHVHANVSLVPSIDVFLVSHALSHCDVSSARAVSHCGVARANPSVRGCISHP